MYIVALVVLSLIAILFLLVPYYRAKDVKLIEAPDISVYKAQLKELANDHASGLLDDEEAARTKTEIERRILKVAETGSVTSFDAPNMPVMISLVTIILFSAAFYAVIGTPGMPDFPIEDHKAAQSSPERLAALAETDAMIDRVTARLATNPDEVQGWAYLANLEMSKGNFQNAAEALYNAHLLAPDTFDYQLMYAESLIMAANERVTPAALIILNEAAKKAPDHAGPKYYLALADFQNGDVDVALDKWKSVQIGLADDDPLMPLINVWINRAEVSLGLAEPLPQTRAPSITAEQAETIQNMSEDEQAELIRQMVMQLADKQAENPTNIEGWIRLSRAYMVLGEREQAIAAMQSAVDNAPDGQKAALQKEVEKLTILE
ncbi:c-type cytochrome biogenesis protein CcmI [Pseudemcibacter aquimaris]|uniref:c-type cytochrome biogenesis protein CcmI n=1 Tax=Pseudemcibacter aquimaris TaxID=2857064 RepID=UPI002013AE1D|nr:c-type cytochrome biogenesis protein CcmI [Pseudemcibacter aquimaris]MCC3861957.1 c-type cytochrome biogenesis protein CcmI [Pseudemcibacter aquimaris]WDU58708.1 c-type cytochrome biogenesis protein CcmI [Pseudemcibacter aquimaris]